MWIGEAKHDDVNSTRVGYVKRSAGVPLLKPLRAMMLVRRRCA
ncbi:MAG: hypothetical protein ACI92S_002466 [Planctomycetaceae bacterium]|jgi:hypothetical protein